MSVVAEFSIHYHQYINENAEALDELPTFAQDAQALIPLYRMMKFVRLFDAKTIALQRTGKMGTYPASLGQEAVSIGIGAAMNDDDVFIPVYRESGTLFMRGVKPSEILAYWGGDERGSDYQHNKEDYPFCVPLASQCLHATGVAKAMQYRKQKRAVVVTIGDGATSEGDFYEAVNLAGVWNLPVVFVVINNQWAISVPLEKQTSVETLAQKGLAGGLRVEQCDGNDVVAVQSRVAEALTKARNGEGPSLIEAKTYRLCDHTTADDASRYRDSEPYEAAKRKEPMIRLKRYLEAKGVWDDEKEKTMHEDCSLEVEAAVKEYLDTPLQAPTSMFDYLYAEVPDALLEQYEEVGSAS